MYLTKEQRKLVIAELESNPFRLDTEIGTAIGVPPSRVKLIRRNEGFPNYSHITRRKQQIQESLTQNPNQTNIELAIAYGTTASSVAKYRAEIGVDPTPRGAWKREIGEGTKKCREMLMQGTELPDLYIAEECGISFAHVARQRDLLGLSRSPRSNRRVNLKKKFDWTGVDHDIKEDIISLTNIAIKYNIPVAWVNERSRSIGVRNRKMTPETRKRVEDMLRQEPRPTSTQIAKAVGLSASTVDKVRKDLGIPRLPPGRPKYEETKRAMVLLAQPNRAPLTEIAKKSGLTVTTVTKIRNRMREIQ